MPAVTPDDTELARRATGGDREAFSLLFDRWLDRSFDVAWHILYNREAAADAAQEAFAAAWSQIGSLRQPESFGGWLLRITRNKALNQLAKQRRSSPVGSEEALVTMDPRQGNDPTTHVEENEYGDLVWAASAALGQDDTSLLNLHLRHDLDTPELAEELGVKPNAVHQRLFRLKKRLADAIAAWVLWRKGDPSCPDLRAILDSAQANSFDAATAKAITRHAGGCDACVSSRKLRLSPEALFGAMPLVVAGPVLRARMVAALGGQGVPASPGSAGAAEPAETTQMDVPSDLASEPGRSDPSPTAELPELNEPGWGDESGDPDAADGTGAPASPGGSQGWRRAAAGAAVAAMVLLIGALVGLTVLADRSGDGAGANEASPTTDAGEASSSTASSDSTTTTTDDPTTTESQDDPGVPGTVDDPIPGTDPSNVTTTPVTTEPPGGEPGAGPEILRFEGRRTGQTCHTDGGTVQVSFAWATSGATSATLGPVGGRAKPVTSPASDSVTRCAQPGSTWVLTAFGDGESVSEPETLGDTAPGTTTSRPGDLATP